MYYLAPPYILEPESCTIVDPEIEEVLYGWPFSVRCEKLFVDMERNFYIYESSYKSNHDDMQTRNASYNATVSTNNELFCFICWVFTII